MAGVLHEVGMLVFWTLRPDEMARQLAEGHAAHDPGIGHARCGQLVMQAWQLPLWLQLAVAHHHEGALPSGMAGDICAITRLADDMAARMAFGLDGDNAQADLDLVLSHCKVTGVEVDALVSELPESVEEFIGALSS